jgi:hypothetical protein
MEFLVRSAMAFGRRFRGVAERLHAEKEAKKVEGRRGTTAAPNKRRAREAATALALSRLQAAFQRSRAQPPLVGGEVSIPKVLGNLGDVAQHAVFRARLVTAVLVGSQFQEHGSGPRSPPLSPQNITG